MSTRRRQRGQAMLEFAVTLPVMLTAVLVIITLEVLFFQLAAVRDAATAAARTAATTRIVPDTPSGRCDSQLIAKAAQRAASIVSVNPANLCADTTNPTVMSQSASTTGTDVLLNITAEPTVYNPCLITATAQYTLRPLGGFTLFAPTVTSSSTIEAAPGCSTAK